MSIGWRTAAGIQSVNGDFGPNVALSAADVGALALTGGTMSGDIDMAGNSILNVDDIAAATVNGSTIDATALASVLGFRDAQTFFYGPPSPVIPFAGVLTPVTTFNFTVAQAGLYNLGLAFLVTGTAQGTQLYTELGVSGATLVGPWLETGIAGGRFILGAPLLQPLAAGANTIVLRAQVTGGAGTGGLIASSICVERKS